MERFGRALSVLALTAAWGCGLEKNGLRDTSDSAIDWDSPVDTMDTGGADVTAADQTLDVDGTRSGDSTVGVEGGVDADADADATHRSEAGRDVAVDSSPEAGPDGPDEASFDAPADGLAETAGDAPADAPPSPILWDGGPIVDPQFYDADWVNFCVALVACNVLPSISACVALLHQPSSPDPLIPPPFVVASVVNARPDCSSVLAALGDGSNCASATPDRCNGNALVTCRWGFTMTVDCGSLGMVCSSGNGNPGCGFGDCSVGQEGLTYCVGPNYLAQCTGGRYVPALDCQTFGGSCVGPDGTAQCRGTGGTSCTAGESCVGTSLVACLGGLLGGVDCAALFDPTFTCITTDAGSIRCAAGTACDGATATDSCSSATEVSYCNAGAPATYDCSANNTYSACTAGHCVP